MTRTLSSAPSMIVLVLAVAVAVAQDCTLNCPEDAPCLLGHADFSGHSVQLGETHINGMHCDCPVGGYLSSALILSMSLQM